jgi:hypothetical protein
MALYLPSMLPANARAHLLPEAGATQERTLEAVRCSPVLGHTPAPGDLEKQFLTPLLLP